MSIITRDTAIFNPKWIQSKVFVEVFQVYSRSTLNWGRSLRFWFLYWNKWFFTKWIFGKTGSNWPFWSFKMELLCRTKNRSDDFWPLKFDFLVLPISRSNWLIDHLSCDILYQNKVNSSCLQVATWKILSILTSDMLNNTTCYFLDFWAAFKLAWL